MLFGEGTCWQARSWRCWRIAGGAYYFSTGPDTPTEYAPAASTSRQGWCQDPNLKPDELRVCATPGLLELDGKLTRMFNDKIAATPSAQQQPLRADEGKWLRETRGGCAQDETCLYKVYRERITYFENLPAQ